MQKFINIFSLTMQSDSVSIKKNTMHAIPAEGTFIQCWYSTSITIQLSMYSVADTLEVADCEI